MHPKQIYQLKKFEGLALWTSLHILVLELKMLN